MDCEILYVVIARKKKTVLCEYAQYTGNFEQISIKIITQLNLIPEKRFYSIVQYDDYELYAFVDNEYIFLAIVDKSHTAITLNCGPNENEWQDCSYYLYEFLYSLKEELYKKYTETELKQSHAYSLVDYVDVLSNSIAIYQANKNQYSKYTRLIIGFPTCEIGYQRKNHESKLSIIRDISQNNELEPESNKELLIEGGDDKSGLNSAHYQVNNQNKKKICQIILIVSLLLAFLLCLIGIVLFFTF